MGTMIGVVVALLVCAGLLGFIGLRSVVPLEVAMLALTAASAVAVLAGLAWEGRLLDVAGELEPAHMAWWARVCAFAVIGIGSSVVLRGVSLTFAGLLVRWGVRVRPAPGSPLAQRVQALRAWPREAAVAMLQQEFLVPRAVVEELLQRVP